MTLPRCVSAATCLLAAIAGTTYLTACGSSPAADPVTVRFGFHESDQVHFEALAEGFHQANAHITIELVPHSWDQVACLRPEDADAFMVRQGYPLLQNRAALLSLEALIEQDIEFDPAGFYPGLLDLLRTDGKAWGVPAGVDPTVI